MAAVEQTIEQVRRIDVDQYKYGFETAIEVVKAPKGLNEDIVRFISDKKGEPAVVSLNPSQEKYEHREKTPPDWATERQKYGFYHELVHAWHITNGTQVTGMHKDTKNSEWQATGLGPWAKDPMSDNVIRSQMGKPPRPEYGLVTY